MESRDFLNNPAILIDKPQLFRVLCIIEFTTRFSSAEILCRLSSCRSCEQYPGIQKIKDDRWEST